MAFIQAQFVADTEYLLLPQPEIHASAEELYRAGLAYSTGNGAPYDLVHAHKWMNLSALRGSDEAKIARRELADLMSRAQIGEAQRQAREWLRKSSH